MGNKPTQTAISPREITIELYRRRLILTWLRDKPEGWRLVSGLWSPFYLQLRNLPSHPDLMQSIGRLVAASVAQEVPDVTRLVGVAMAGIPIATAASIAGKVPCAFTRKVEGARDVSTLSSHLEEYGDHSLVEGELRDGDVLVLVDDLVTRFDSKLVALEMLRLEMIRRKISDFKTKGVAVIVDREQGAQEEAARLGIALIPLLRFRSQCLGFLAEVASSEELETISEYLSTPEAFQSTDRQEYLRDLAQRKMIR